MRRYLLLWILLCVPVTASAQTNTPTIWYAANMGLEGFACRGCSAQFEGCGCTGWLSCQAGICEPAGGRGEPCLANDSRAIWTGCQGDFGCVDKVCDTVGTEGEACRTDATYYNPFLRAVGKDPYKWTPACDPDLYCWNHRCEVAPEPSLPPPPPPCVGAEGCECRQDERRIEGCDATLLCDGDNTCYDTWDLTFRALYASEAVYDAEADDMMRAESRLDFVGGLRVRDYSNGAGSSDVEALIASNDEVIVVAFAGSESLSDWLANADMVDWSWWGALFPFAAPVSFLDPVDPVDPDTVYDGGWMRCRSNDALVCSLPNFKVHERFLEYAHDTYHGFVKDALVAEYNRLPGRRIEFVGHSLGGAVAQLVAGQVRAQLGWVASAVTTFGSPKVGDEDWKTAYEMLLRRQTHRWVVHRDPVPNLPALSTWKRAGQQHYISEPNGTYELDGPNHAREWHDIQVEDHYLGDSYLDNVEKVAPCGHKWNSRRCP